MASQMRPLSLSADSSASLRGQYRHCLVAGQNLLLDASHTAAGAIRIISSMGVSVGPAVFVERFAQIGVRIDAGHETLIHQSWMLETCVPHTPCCSLSVCRRSGR